MLSVRRWYNTDAHAYWGMKGMTYLIHAASISSTVGELRIGIASSKENGTKGRANWRANNAGEGSHLADDAALPNMQPPQTETEAMQC